MAVTASRPFRILQVNPSLIGEGINPSTGSKSRLSVRLSWELALRGQDVGIFPYPEPVLGTTYQIQNGGSSLHLLSTVNIPPLAKTGLYYWMAARLPIPRRSLKMIRMDAMFLSGLHQAIHEFKPDIIHNHASLSDLPLLFHALGKHIPLILTHHTHTPGKHLDLYRTVVFSMETLRSMACATDHSLHDRSRLIRPAVERLFTDPAISIPGNRKGILFVGGLRLEMGLQHLLFAFAKSSTLRKIPLRVCGVGPEEKSFRETVRRFRIPAIFLGNISTEQTRQEMLNAELLVIPCQGEGFNLALAEAACCGTPVIGWQPQVEEMRALLRMECGLGFNPTKDTQETLMECILELRTRRDLVSSPQRRKLAAKARAFFSMERYTTEYMCLYDDLVDGHV